MLTFLATSPTGWASLHPSTELRTLGCYDFRLKVSSQVQATEFKHCGMKQHKLKLQGGDRLRTRHGPGGQQLVISSVC
eukprot:scaffold655453_cov67-Prasinocladus_malaysianus.AAC.2